RGFQSWSVDIWSSKPSTSEPWPSSAAACGTPGNRALRMGRTTSWYSRPLSSAPGTNVDMPGPSSAGPSMASSGSVVHDQNVPHLTLQYVADGGEGAEPDCARPVVLEDREVDHGDADAVRQLSQRHGSLLEQLIQPAVDAVPVLELGWAHTSPASSRSLTAPLRQMLPRTTSASPAATALQGRAASPKAGTLARSANWEVSRIQRLSSHAP